MYSYQIYRLNSNKYEKLYKNILNFYNSIKSDASKAKINFCESNHESKQGESSIVNQSILNLINCESNQL